MRLLAAVIITSLTGFHTRAASACADEPVMGTFRTDAVLLLTRNEEQPGQDDLSHRHGNFVYLFATDASREAFKADPARFEIQLGGACARMGALSGCADPDRFAVHEGKLYIFASDGCRSGFLSNPPAVLEPLADPAPEGDPEQLARGRALIDQCVAWMGGPDRLDALHTLEYREESRVENRGEQHLSIEVTTLRPPATARTDYRWDSSSWTKTITPDDAFFIDSGAEPRSMHPEQRTIMARQMARHVPMLLRCRARPGFTACHTGPAADGRGEVVAVHFDSATTELLIEPTTGYLLGVRHIDWGPTGRLGVVERRFSAFADLDGLRIPCSWQVWYDGERAESLDKALIGCTANPDLPADFFTRQGKPVTPRSAIPGG